MVNRIGALGAFMGISLSVGQRWLSVSHSERRRCPHPVPHCSHDCRTLPVMSGTRLYHSSQFARAQSPRVREACNIQKSNPEMVAAASHPCPLPPLPCPEMPLFKRKGKIVKGGSGRWCWPDTGSSEACGTHYENNALHGMDQPCQRAKNLVKINCDILVTKELLDGVFFASSCTTSLLQTSPLHATPQGSSGAVL